MSLLLGVPDRRLNENETTTWETNKIGGTPDWLQEDTPLPCCRHCQREMTLVAQIYCPLTGSPFHRCLHIFVCPSKPCSVQEYGWRVVRTQRLEDRGSQQSQVEDRGSQQSQVEDRGSQQSQVEDRGSQQSQVEDRGSQQSQVEDRGSQQSQVEDRGSQQSQVEDRGSQQSQVASTEDDWVADQEDWGVGQEDWGDDDHDQENDSQAPSQSQHPSTCQETTDRFSEMTIANGSCPVNTDASESHPRLSVPEPSSGPHLDAHCPAHSHGNDCGTNQSDVEPPEQVTAEPVAVDDDRLQRMMGLLASGGVSGKSGEDGEHKVTNRSETFPAFYLDVLAEADLEEEIPDHVNDLLKDYELREGQHFAALLSQSKGQSSGDVETYDKTEVKHGDRQCYKFIKRLQACPSQCIRYQWKGTPLLINKMDASLSVARCEQCQAPRVFELQLVSPVIPLLKFPSQTEPQVEFSTVLVFTCGNSCWSDSDAYREEVAVLQQDPDQHLFR